MLPNETTFFRDLFRRARSFANQDAEGFQEIVFALEKFGSFRAKKILDLGRYERFIKETAEISPLCSAIPSEWRTFHLPFDNLYSLVRLARNDALHHGAYARHLTNHAVQLSLIIEDALMKIDNRVCDHMVRDVIVAQEWQPVSFVRQQMLANSFSYLPISIEKDWYLLSDSDIAKYLSGTTVAERKRKLGVNIREALTDGLKSQTAIKCLPDEPASAAVDKFDGQPLLVVDNSDRTRLVGIVTAFDLL